jgi:hypothetical protein
MQATEASVTMLTMLLYLLIGMIEHGLKTAASYAPSRQLSPTEKVKNLADDEGDFVSVSLGDKKPDGVAVSQRPAKRTANGKLTWSVIENADDDSLHSATAADLTFIECQAGTAVPSDPLVVCDSDIVCTEESTESRTDSPGVHSVTSPKFNVPNDNNVDCTLAADSVNRNVSSMSDDVQCGCSLNTEICNVNSPGIGNQAESKQGKFRKNILKFRVLLLELDTLLLSR